MHSIKNSTVTIIAFLFVLIAFQGCLEDECTSTSVYTRWEPVYATLDEIRTNIEILSPRELENPGKIYFYNNYILINEFNEGVHIIDNRDQSNPIPVSFISIPGNKEMAVKGNRLYADNYIDLLTINISDPASPVLVERTEDVFSGFTLFADLGYLIDYIPNREPVVLDCDQQHTINNGWGWFQGDILSASTDLNNVGVPSSRATASSNPGIGGSFARFTISKDHLYIVDDTGLFTFDITDCDNPSQQGRIEIRWGIETIYPLLNNLFIGSNNGMLIYSIANPAEPAFVSEFNHARACDPVFVQGDVAYITLRNGTGCWNGNNQLDIVDVSNLSSPQLLASHNVNTPHGLSVLNDELYLCEGESGLRVFDKADHSRVLQNELASIMDIHAYDIITLPNETAMLIGDDGFYQYDISDPSQLIELSKITVNRD